MLFSYLRSGVLEGDIQLIQAIQRFDILSYPDQIGKLKGGRVHCLLLKKRTIQAFRTGTRFLLSDLPSGGRKFFEI
jgi:hypothetical protein